MGRGASKLGGGGVQSAGGNNVDRFYTQSTADLIDDLARQMTTEDYDSRLDNGDMQSMVELYAEYNGLDDNAIIDAVRNRAEELSGENKSVSGKPFNAKDWKTWTKGTEVLYQEESDFGIADGVLRKGVKGNLISGIISKVGDDHVIVKAEDGTNLWLDKDTKSMFRVKKKK